MTHKLFNTIIKRPISLIHLKEILKSEVFTLRLISEYRYFFEAEVERVYHSYIKNCIRYKKHLYNTIELAGLINYVSPRLIKLIDELLLSRRGAMLKLSCMDYLCYNQELVGKKRYKELNVLAKTHSSSELIIFQAELNLALTRPIVLESMNPVFSMLKETADNALFYRIKSVLTQDKSIGRKNARDILNIVKKTLSENRSIHKKDNLIIDIIGPFVGTV